MGIFNRLFSGSIESRAQSLVNSKLSQLEKANDEAILRVIGQNVATETELNATTKTHQIMTYEKSIWVYSCVYVIASAAAGVPIKIFTQKANGEKGEEVKSGDVWDMIYEPNEIESYADFFEKWYTYLELTGDTFCFRNKEVAPDTLWILRPDYMKIIPGKMELVDHYEYTPNGSQMKRLTKENVFHIRYLNPQSELYGQSPISPAEQSIIQDLNAIQYVKNFFKKGGAINMWAKAPGNMGNTEFKRVKQELKEQTAGIHRMHDIPVLNDTELKALGAPPKDMMLDDLKDRVRDEILSAFGVPPIMFGYLAGKETYNNASTQKTVFWENTMVPKMRKTEDKLNKELFQPLGYVCEYDYGIIEALQADEKKKAEVGKIQIESGQFTPNEVRSRQYSADPSDDPKADELHIKTGSNRDNNLEKQYKGPNILNSQIHQYLRKQEEEAFADGNHRAAAALNPVIIKRFKSMEERVLNNLANIGPRDGSLALVMPPEQLVKTALDGFDTEEVAMFNDLVAVQKEQVKDFAKSDLTRYTGHRPTAEQLQDIADDLNADVTKWGNFSAEVVTQTQAQRVENLMKKAIKTEMPFRDIQKGVSKIFKGTERANFPWARMIARTESGKIANAAKIESIDKAGFKFKQWVHSGKHDARHEHVELGKRRAIPLNKTFDYVNGEGQLIKMRFPHDPTAPPSETVNCGCTIIPVDEP